MPKEYANKFENKVWGGMDAFKIYAGPNRFLFKKDIWNDCVSFRLSSPPVCI